MSFALIQLLVAGVVYLLMLFGIAYMADRGIIPTRIVRHPVVYILSLGVIAGAWPFFGMVDVAARYGYSYLSYFFGISALFLFGTLVLGPMMRISRMYQLRSIPDMLTFRYRSQWAGIVLTIFMLLAMLPLFALQITAVSDTILIITDSSFELFPGDKRQGGLAFAFCCIITLFTVLFGARHVGREERHDGLITAIAFESLSKLVVLMIIAGVCVFGVFGGTAELQQWLEANAEVTRHFGNDGSDDVRYFMLLFFMAAVLMPHSFHMIFAERPNQAAFTSAAWGFPLYLLLLSLPVILILWGAQNLGIGVPLQYATVGIGVSLQSPQLEMLAYIGGLSAASSTIIVATLALASMCLNHLVLATYQPDTKDIYRWILMVRRLLIVGIILVSYLFYRVVSGQHDLAALGIAAFSGVLQFMPGVLAMLYWPEANRNGFVAGVVAGMTIWFFLVLLPLLQPESVVLVDAILPSELGDTSSWQRGTLLSLGANILLFVLGSVFFKQSEEEQMAAEICSTDELSRPIRQAMDVHSPAEMKERLTKSLGRSTAERELSNALRDLDMEATESRPYALRRLRERIEANLSGLLGPSSAYEIINLHLPYVRTEHAIATEDIQFIESRLENYQVDLSGLAAELDSLRRYHRATLQALPVGVCIVGADREVTLWNNAMVELTNISAEQVVGSSVHGLTQPWSNVLTDFVESSANHRYKQHIFDANTDRWISLHKTRLGPVDQLATTQAIVIEDLTETQILEQELTHSERLASIGRLAAGVAHEIGNPVTGIACIAQNLASEFPEQEIQESTSDILLQTQRVSTIVQSLVNFSHAGDSRRSIDFESVNVLATVNEVIQLLNLNKHATEIDFCVLIDPDMHIAGDQQRLSQVFINLLSNARDASPEGSVVEVAANIIDEHSIDVTVTDDGEGIARDHHEQIFEPFFTTKQPGDGTGLGLALVYSIIEDHSGSIQVESPFNKALGRGTRFTLKLPRLDARPDH
ncbi:MAG: ATP-binding protein [Pseudomonadales bacterium]